MCLYTQCQPGWRTDQKAWEATLADESQTYLHKLVETAYQNPSEITCQLH